MALLHRPHVQESLARFLHAREELACGTARVELLALPLPVPHCPGCSISCMAIPGCKRAPCEYPPFPRGCSGTVKPVEQSLALPTPREALAHSGHSLHALLKAQNWGFLKLGGQLGPCLLCHPQQLLVRPLQAGKLGLLRALSLCASHKGAVGGSQLLLTWRGAQMRHNRKASLKGFTTANNS